MKIPQNHMQIAPNITGIRLIPIKLQKSDFRFVLVEYGSKKPIHAWKDTTKPDFAQYAFDAPQIQNHISQNGSVGIIHGFGNHAIIDDDTGVFDFLVSFNTFITQSRSKRKYYHFLISDLPQNSFYSELKKDGVHVGEIRADTKHQTVFLVDGQCTILNDAPILEIHLNEILLLLQDFLPKKKGEIKQIAKNPIADVVDLSVLTQYGNEYFGTHPIHGSTHGKNFWVNTEKNLWHCYRCNSGGDALYWLAVANGFIDCSEAKRGALRGDVFLKVAKIFEEKTGKKILKEEAKEENFTLFEPFGGEEFVLPPFEYKTNHLAKYEDFVSALGIRGQQYAIINKLFWYQLNAAPIKLNLFQVGEFSHDLRINVVLPLPMARGKNEYKTVAQNILKQIGEHCHEPEISHVEQLIGTIIVESEKNPATNRVEKVTKKVYGWFHEDLLQFDESHTLMTSDRDTLTDARRHIRKATNPYGKNTLEKKLTKIATEEKMEYNPPTQLQLYTQPKFIEASFVEDGTARRFRIPYVEMPGADQSNHVSEKLRSKRDTTKNIADFVEHLLLVKTKNDGWVFSDGSIELIDKCQMELSTILQTLPKKVREYALGLSYQNTEDIIRFSCILAASNYENEIKPHHILLAYADVVEVIYHTLFYISERVLGSFDYGVSWKGATGADQSTLMFLAEQGAFDEDSAIELKKFKEFIQELFGLSERAVTSKIALYEATGWVKTKHPFGAYLVYLGFKPKIEHVGNERNACNPKSAKILNEVKNNYSVLVSMLANEQGDAVPFNFSAFKPASIANIANMDKSVNTLQKQADSFASIGQKCDFCNNKFTDWQYKGQKKICAGCLRSQKGLVVE